MLARTINLRLIALGCVVVMAMILTGCRSTTVPADIMYVTADEALVLLRLDLATMSVLSRQTLHSDGVISAAWSADGTRIAFVTGGGDDWELVIAAVDETGTEVLKRYPTDTPGYPSWAPSGDWLAVAYNWGWFPGGGVVALYNSGTCDRADRLLKAGALTWSPDGTQLILRRSREVDPPIPIGGGESSDLLVYELKTGATREIARGTSEAMYSCEAWTAPDRALVWRLGADSSKTLLSFDPTMPGEVALSPAELPAIRNPEAVREILPEELCDSFIGEFSWRPDLSAVAVRVRGEEGVDIWIVRPGNGGHVQYVQLGPGYGPAWRPGH